jgi:hypothetical protein
MLSGRFPFAKGEEGLAQLAVTEKREKRAGLRVRRNHS